MHYICSKSINRELTESSEVNKTLTYFAPQQAPMVVDWTIDTPRHSPEPPEVSDDQECANAESNTLCAVLPACGENKVVKKVSEHENGKVKSGKLIDGLIGAFQLQHRRT